MWLQRHAPLAFPKTTFETWMVRNRREPEASTVVASNWAQQSEESYWKIPDLWCRLALSIFLTFPEFTFLSIGGSDNVR